MDRALLKHLDTDIGILICGHGSRNRLAVKEFAELVDSIRRLLPNIPIEYGYLEFAIPIITDGLDKLRDKGVKRVIAIPAMLFAAGHVKNDIPSVLKKYSAKTGLIIDYGSELGINNSMISAAGARITESVKDKAIKSNSDTLLVVVGRGSSDPDANSNISKISRILVESFGFGWGESLYSGVTFPLVEPGLRHIVKLGFKRIIVLPYFLFSGVLVSRIKNQTNIVANSNPDIEFIFANYLGNHPLVVSTFLERIYQAFNGDNSMNCSLCKYRSPLLGFEKEAGLAQVSHHHHVEGLTASCDLCENECTEECQDQEKPEKLIHHHHNIHSHEHFPYPNSDHPLGPSSLN